MGSFARAVRYLKDFWKVVIRGDNDDLRRQTLSIQEQLARMRTERLAADKAREEAALNQARSAVEKLRELHNNLLIAEKAASEFAAKIGEYAKSNMEAEEETQQKIRMKLLMRQKELYQEAARFNIQNNVEGRISEALSQLNDEKAVDNKQHGTAIVTDSAPTQLSSMENKSSAEQTSSGNKNAETNHMDFVEKVSPNVLAQVMEEARKQVLLEERVHVNALNRNKAIMEKEIEARELAEREKLSASNKA